MKAKFNLLLFVLFFNGLGFAQQNKIADKHYLQILFNVNEVVLKKNKVTESVLCGAQIRIFNSDNKEIFNDIYYGKKRLIAKLPLNQNFAVYVSKDEYVSKHFSVNTIVPKQKTAIYMFSLDVSLFRKVIDLNIELIDPIGIVQFYSKEVKFDYDYEYTDEVNATMKEKYCEYYIILEQRELEQEMERNIRVN